MLSNALKIHVTRRTCRKIIHNEYFMCIIMLFFILFYFVSECLRFTLEEFVDLSVYANVPVNKTFIANHLGECFLSCFDRSDCLTFTFEANNNTCKVYTACGTSCSSFAATGVTTYKKHCFTGCTFYLSM